MLYCFIEVTFVDLVTESGKTVTKYIPDTMSVVKARQLALKLLKIRGIQCVISYRAHQVSYKLSVLVKVCDIL